MDFQLLLEVQENRHEKIFTEFVICFGGGKDERVDTKKLKKINLFPMLFWGYRLL